MISRLFPKIAREPQASLPAGLRLYAIGDIHGRLDLLERLLAQIDEDDARRPAAETRLIFLGDLIDRGPDSMAVVERLRQLCAERPATTILLGNHEEVFLLALKGDLKALDFFARIGGRETILSYGVSEHDYCELETPELLAALQARVPASHVDFLQGFENMVVHGDYAFVHAGVRPAVPLAQQRLSDLRWIRDEFIDHRGDLEKVIVHGHTIADKVEVRRHRIGLDTGAYASGVLTAMGFEGSDRWVIQAQA